MCCLVVLLEREQLLLGGGRHASSQKPGPLGEQALEGKCPASKTAFEKEANYCLIMDS